MKGQAVFFIQPQSSFLPQRVDHTVLNGGTSGSLTKWYTGSYREIASAERVLLLLFEVPNQSGGTEEMVALWPQYQPDKGSNGRLATVNGKSRTPMKFLITRLYALASTALAWSPFLLEMPIARQSRQ